jgi:hypothetical protein
VLSKKRLDDAGMEFPKEKFEGGQHDEQAVGVDKQIFKFGIAASSGNDWFAFGQGGMGTDRGAAGERSTARPQN